MGAEDSSLYAFQLVGSKFQSMDNYVNTTLAATTSYMSTLQSMLNSMEVPGGDDIPFNSPDITPLDFNDMPVFSDILDSLPDFDFTSPPTPNLNSIPAVGYNSPGPAPLFTDRSVDVPSINFGQKPDNPSIESIDLPHKPDLNIPPAPTLADFDIPNAPIIDFPDFDTVAPPKSTLYRLKEFEHDEAEYASDIRLRLFNKILDDIANGGTGLHVDVERDLYDRGRERQRVENDRLYRDVQAQFSGAGFGLPSGSLASRMFELSSEISRKNDQLNREITISQAELAQKNTQFTVDQARQIESSLMDFFTAQQSRVLEAERAIALQSVEIFNAKVSELRLGLERYQAEASVFSERVKAKAIAIDAYRSQIEGLKVTAEVQQSRVSLYTASIGALEAAGRLYAVEMESSKIKADIQVAKVGLFKAETDAYIASLGAEKLKVDIHGAQVDAEKTRVAVFGEKVKAYQSQVDTKKIELEAMSINAEAAIKTNQQLIEAYVADIQAYNAEVSASSATANVLTQGFIAQSDSYSSQVNAQGKMFELQLGEMDTQVEVAKLNLQHQLAKIESIQNGYVALKTLQVGGTEGIMNVNAQLAASAMNAVNASANVGYNSSHSKTVSVEE